MSDGEQDATSDQLTTGKLLQMIAKINDRLDAIAPEKINKSGDKSASRKRGREQTADTESSDEHPDEDVSKEEQDTDGKKPRTFFCVIAD